MPESCGVKPRAAPASKAQLRVPEAVTVDNAGNVYIADSANQRIRRVNATTGTISTIAGSGRGGDGGDGGTATQAHLSHPRGVAVDGAGNLYISDSGNHRIRKVAAATGTISTIAGTGEWDYGGDGGLAAAALLGCSIDMAVGDNGNVYIADMENHRVRVLKPHAAVGSGDCASALTGR